jgi:hypothetical protein
VQGDREPVDLGLGRHLERLIGRKPEKGLGAHEEPFDLLVAEGVVDRQHRHAVPHLAERADRRGADFQRGAVVADELGKARLDRIVPRPQGIVCGVGDLRRVLAVVELIVMGDFGGEPGKLESGFRLVEGGRGALVQRPSGVLF